MTKEGQVKRSLNGIMAIITKIWSHSTFELDHSLRCLVLDVVPGARARTSARPRTGAPPPPPPAGGPPPERVLEPPSVVLACALKDHPRTRHTSLHTYPR
jgi:hypothetical protein